MVIKTSAIFPEFLTPPSHVYIFYSYPSANFDRFLSPPQVGTYNKIRTFIRMDFTPFYSYIIVTLIIIKSGTILRKTHCSVN